MLAGPFILGDTTFSKRKSDKLHDDSALMRYMTLGMLQRPVRAPKEILLGYTLEKFLFGTWKGPGGKDEPAGESIEQTTAREVEAEIGVQVLAQERAGLIEFRFTSGKVLPVYVQRITKWRGNPHAMDAMAPQWFPMDALPSPMPPADAIWLPKYLSDGKVNG